MVMRSTILLFLLPALLILLLCLWVYLGIYVYRDARRRGMSPVLWTLVVLLIPNLLGLLIYLIARSPLAEYTCPECRQPVKAEYELCPYCGTRLKGSCPACGRAVEADWKLCPSCGENLSNAQPITPPVRRKDRMWVVVLCAVLVPLLLVGTLVFFGMNSYKVAGSSSLSVAEDGSTLQYDSTEYLSDGSVIHQHLLQLPVDALEPALSWWDVLPDEQSISVLLFHSEEQSGGILYFPESLSEYTPQSSSVWGDRLRGQSIMMHVAMDEPTEGGTAWVFTYNSPHLLWGLDTDPSVPVYFHWASEEDTPAVIDFVNAQLEG